MTGVRVSEEPELPRSAFAPTPPLREPVLGMSASEEPEPLRSKSALTPPVGELLDPESPLGAVDPKPGTVPLPMPERLSEPKLGMVRLGAGLLPNCAMAAVPSVRISDDTAANRKYRISPPQ
jgi:hypothetical protein